MEQVITELQRLARRSRGLLIAQRLAVVLAWTLGVLLALVLVDFALRLPSAFRLVLLLGGLGALGWFSWTYLWPALAFRPSLTEIALRVERVLPALSGRLATSVEFAAAGMDQSNALAARSVRETQTRLMGESVNRVINVRQTWRGLGAFALMLAVALGVAIASPVFAATGLQRILLPYSDAKWPARTGVESLTQAQVHPRGQALALRAAVTRGAASQRLEAHYRVRLEGAWQPWQRVVLTQQGATNVHERLIDTNAERLELYFRSDDDQTNLQRIELVPPPAVRRASLTVTPPEYAARYVPEYRAELGQGLDARAITETASLTGSTASLRLELNKPLPLPPQREVQAWLAETLGWSDEPRPQFSIDPNAPAVWRLQWTLDRTRLLSLHLVDQHGLSNADPITYRIEAVDDLPPSVTVTQPQSDDIVLPTAVVALRSEARDDVAIATMTLEAHVQNNGRGIDESLAQAPAWRQEERFEQPTAFIQRELDLAPLNLAAGDVLLISGVAVDVLESQQHGSGQTTRSAVRRLRVIAETDFATQLRRQLSAVRQNAIRIEAQQAELQEDVAERGVPESSGMDRAQAQIAERIATQRASVQDISRLVRQNRLDDAQLNQLLAQANDLLDAAGRAANRAVEEMQKQRSSDREIHHGEHGEPGEHGGKSEEENAASRAVEDPGATGQAGDRQPTADSRQPTPVTEAQQEVRDELSDLIKLLDRDEDTWLVRRQLESLLREQSELAQATGQVGQETMGRRPEDLTERQRSEIEKIAQRQRDLRDEARKLIENLRQRANAMQQIDPQAAQSMRSAADTAEQQQLDQDMENAAQQAQQNQMTSASASQQSAQSTMQRMLNEIENTRRAQAQQLLRQLASLLESIQRLITVQENELTNLAVARDAQNFGGLDRGMIRLNQNTQAVAGEARAAGQEARRIARTLDRAADSQGAAILALRAQPVNVEDAESAENRSLELLREAKAQAEELQKQTQEEEVRRKREELLGRYRAFAERQIAVREETLPLTQAPQLDRRQLVEARRLSNSQNEIRTGLNELRDVTSEILDSPIFVHVHRSIDAWSAGISDSLTNGTVNVNVTDRQQQIADSIGRLIKALEESIVPPGEFEQQDQQQGGGGGSGDQPLIPPIAQLKLLQGLQEQVYDLTKELDARQDLDDAQRRERLRDIGQQQRELMDLGRQLLEMLQQQQRPGPPPVEIQMPPETEETP